MKPSRIQVVEHPLVATKLSILRSKNNRAGEFRRNLQELAALLLCEAAQNWEIDTIEVETPLKSCDGAILAKPIVLMPVQRVLAYLKECRADCPRRVSVTSDFIAMRKPCAR
jgi:uracil phosphoribosyltransferase